MSRVTGKTRAWPGCTTAEEGKVKRHAPFSCADCKAEILILSPMDTNTPEVSEHTVQGFSAGAVGQAGPDHKNKVCFPHKVNELNFRSLNTEVRFGWSSVFFVTVGLKLWISRIFLWFWINIQSIQQWRLLAVKIVWKLCDLNLNSWVNFISWENKSFTWQES